MRFKFLKQVLSILTLLLCFDTTSAKELVIFEDAGLKYYQDFKESGELISTILLASNEDDTTHLFLSCYEDKDFYESQGFSAPVLVSGVSFRKKVSINESIEPIATFKHEGVTIFEEYATLGDRGNGYYWFLNMVDYAFTEDEPRFFIDSILGKDSVEVVMPFVDGGTSELIDFSAYPEAITLVANKCGF